MEHFSNTYLPSQHIGTLTQMQLKTEAGRVFVRIIDQTADCTYTAAVHGQRMTVHSDIQLAPGTSFRARITVSDGKIHIIPEENIQQTQNSGALKLSNTTLLQDARAASFFSALGLPPDGLSLRTAQFMLQSGLKYTSHQLRRAYSTAKRFPGSEENASAAVLLLEGKKIPSDIDTIEAVLEMLFGSTEGKDELSKRLNDRKTAPLSWFVIPFEYQLSEGGTLIRGSIRILQNTETNKTEKMTLSAFAPEQTYHFSVSLDSGKKTMKYCLENEPSEAHITQMTRILSQILEKTQLSSILYDRCLKDDFFDSSDTDILIVREKV